MKNKKLLFSLPVILAVIVMLTLSATGTFNNQFGQNPTGDGGTYKSSMEYLSALRNNQVTGTIDPVDIIVAHQSALKAGGSLTNWENAGPDNFAGRTRSLLYDKTDPQFTTIYAATVAGGLWKSTTGGILWDQIPGTAHIKKVSCMIQDANGKIYVGTGENYSVHFSASYPGSMGNGIFVSDDGLNFQVLPSTQPIANDSTSSWSYINNIAVHPTNPQVLYAATHNGLLYSADAGTTWEYARDIAGNYLLQPALDVKIGADGITVATVNNFVHISDNGDPDNFINYSTGNADQGLPFSGIGRVGVAIAPTNPSTLYALVTFWSGSLENIYLSVDRGVTWRVIGPGGSSSLNIFGQDNVGYYAMSIIVHPTNPGRVLIGGNNLWQGTKLDENGFYEWQNKLGTGGVLGFINSNHHVYAFKPDDPNTMMIGTDRGIFRSVNGLVSFQNMNRNFITTQCYSVAFNRDGRLLTGTHANAALIITENGNTPMDAKPIERQYWHAANVAMTIFNHDAAIWATLVPATGSQQAVPIRRSFDLGASTSLYSFSPVTTSNNFVNFLPPMVYWETPDYPHSRDSVTHLLTDTILVVHDSIYTLFPVRSASSRYPFTVTVPASLLPGDTIVIPPTQNNNDTIRLFGALPGDSIRVLDPIATRLYYSARVGTRNDIYMTKEAINFSKSPKWYKIFEPQGITQSLAVSDDGDYLWVGTRNGRLYRLGNLNNVYDDNTASFNSSGYAVDVYESDAFTGRVITSIAVDPQNNDHVIVTLGNYGNSVYVFRSTNATSASPSFESVQSNLPLMPVYASLIEMKNSNIVMLGTELGMWTTDNISNPTWMKASSDLGEVTVFQIKQQTRTLPTVVISLDQFSTEVFHGIDNYGLIYAATFGRGIYKTYDYHIVGINEIPHSDLTASNNRSRLVIYPNPAKESVFVSYEATRASEAHLQVIDLSGRIVISAQHKIVAGSNILQTDISSLKKGIYIIQLKDGGLMLTNKLIVR